MLKFADVIKKSRLLVTVILALAGIGLMAYYDSCDTACSYLKGDILGIDLKWVGIAFMSVILAFAAFRQTPFVRALLAAGLGVEVYLYAFQIQNDVYCPFCLAFSAMVIALFLINYEVPSAWRENRGRMWLYFLGEANFPGLRIRKLPLLIMAILGYLFIVATFSGAAIPAYAQDKAAAIPSLGGGTCEVLIFTDYFCPPCRRIDLKAETLFKDLLKSGRVKIIFVDVPFSRVTPLYAKYYLYAANANADANSILRVRKLLFDAAQVMRISEEGALIKYLKDNHVAWKSIDEKIIFPKLSSLIRENKINATPTCVIKVAQAEAGTYVGSDEIWSGLTKLKEDLAAVK